MGINAEQTKAFLANIKAKALEFNQNHGKLSACLITGAVVFVLTWLYVC